jgi:hypothetical protein
MFFIVPVLSFKICSGYASHASHEVEEPNSCLESLSSITDTVTKMVF